MLRTTKMELLAKNLIFVGESSTFDKVSADSKINKTKSKNMIILDLLAKFKPLVELSLETDFLTLRARLTFTKLRQLFLKASILHHFDRECHSWIKKMYWAI